MTFPTALAPNVEALIARVLAEDGPQLDTSQQPPAEGRRLAAQYAARWNRTLPPLADRSELAVPADAALGTSDVRALRLTPADALPGTLLFVHGGGFAFCSPETHLRCAATLAVESGLTVISPDYRLAPEHPFPGGLKDVVATLRRILTDPASLGLTAGPVILAGDSAGCNLALAAMLHDLDRLEGVAGALLFYGVYGADFETASYVQFQNGPGLTRPKMQCYWDWYVDAAGRRDALAAPILASDEQLRRLPPLYVTAAGIDPLLSDTLLFHDRLKAVGRTDPLDVTEGVLHGFLQQGAELPEARAALERAGVAARRMTGRT